MCMLLLRLQHNRGSRGRYDAPRYALGADSDANANTHRGHPDPYAEGAGYAEVTSTVVSPTLVALVISISDSLASDQGNQVVCDGETNPLERLEVPVMERILLHLVRGVVLSSPLGAIPTCGEGHNTHGKTALPQGTSLCSPSTTRRRCSYGRTSRSSTR